MNRDLGKIVRDLRTVDWDFPVQFSGTSRIVHWYPGTYPPELPATLLQAFSSQDDIIFDPYAGAGTTGAEAVRFGRRALLVESNPIGAASSYGLTGLVLLKSIRPELLAPLFDSLEAAFSRANRARTTGMLLGLDEWYQREIDRSLSRVITPTPEAFLQVVKPNAPRWHLLRPWFDKRTLQQVRKAISFAVDAQQGSFCKLLGLLAVSGVLRAASSQTKSWGHIADNVLPKRLTEKDLFSLLVTWVGRARAMITSLELVRPNVGSERRVAVVAHSWNADGASSFRNPFRDKSLLLVTSPPYANAIDYTLSQRLSLYLFGYSDDVVAQMVAKEIGARRKRFSSCAETTWGEELNRSLIAQLKLLDTEAHIAMVLPHRDAGRDVGKERLSEALKEHGWTELFRVNRSIRQSRTRQSWTSIKKETIYVYRHANL